MRKLFSLSLKEKAFEWYRLLHSSHLLDRKELISLFYSKFYPLHEIHQDRNYIYNFWPHDGESIAQAWGRLKSLILKCPNHELSKDIIVNNFHARLSHHDKEIQVKRLMVNGILLKRFNTTLKIGRSTKVKGRI